MTRPRIEQRDYSRPLEGYVIVTRSCSWCEGKGCRRCLGGGLETSEQHFTYADEPPTAGV